MSAVISVSGVFVSVAAIAVTVTLWRADVRRRRKDDAVARRREIVALVMGLAEKTARLSGFGFVSQFWFKPELEWALVLPRVYYGLERTDASIARWAAVKIRHIQSATASSVVVREASELAYGLAAWDRGDRPLEWFAQHAPTGPDPTMSSWKVPWPRRLLKWVVRMRDSVMLGVIIAVYGVILKFVGRQFREI